ncbi:MAG: DUF2130 domain-containing protein [Cardiobacteriaceae bacterium]|nr:DUF2130 domain-containing protein [Cardiobacteriaceae bacterium]
MQITCPHCNEIISLDQNLVVEIMQKIRDEAFNEELEKRLSDEIQKEQQRYNLMLQNELQKKEIECKNSFAKREKELEQTISGLHTRVQIIQSHIDEKLNLAVKNKELECNSQFAAKEQEMQGKILSLQNKITADEELNQIKFQTALESERQKFAIALKQTQDELNYYKDFKSRLNIKLVGESLEQHCLIEFNKMRALLPGNVYFEKDNEVISGSKADFIYRESDENNVEIISIIFEMKNELEESKTKHRNEEFLAKLDKDRANKNCEYAVLVSLLEADNDFYNAGIVMSYRYPKMFVIRPQFFIPLISILRNTAMNTLSAKKALIEQQNRNIDITNFEESLNKFKKEFGYNYEQASKKFQNAIDEIDKTIDHLQKVKENLLSSGKQLRLANDKTEKLTIKKLTRNNPTMKQAFRELQNEEDED